MGPTLEFFLEKVDYMLQTRSGSWGTDSKVVLEVLTKRYDGTWQVVSDKWVEPGNTGKLDAGKTEWFTRKLAMPVLLGDSGGDQKGYEKMVRFRFRIQGSDKWSPSDIVMKPTFAKRDWKNMGGLWESFQVSWDYDPKNWVLSTDPAEGSTTLTLKGPD